MFLKLRGRMKELGMEQYLFAKKLGRSTSYISHRMTGKHEWLLSEMYAALDILCVPYDQLGEYFPKGGKSKAVRVSRSETEEYHAAL